MLRHRSVLLTTLWVLCSASGCAPARHSQSVQEVKFTSRNGNFRVETPSLALECSPTLQLRVYFSKEGKWLILSSGQELPPLITVRADHKQVTGFSVSGPPSIERGIRTTYGRADRVSVEAHDSTRQMGVTLRLDFPYAYPDVVILESQVKNLHRSRPTQLDEIGQASLRLSPASLPSSQQETVFWSLQGGGYVWGGDYILPVRAGFSQENYTGPKGKGNGGGFPLVDLWRPEMGLAVALLEPKPSLAWVPVNVTSQGVAEVKVITRPSTRLEPGDEFAPPPVTVVVHAGDFYDAVVRYRQLMEHLGVTVIRDYHPDDYSAAWCTWGFRRRFTTKDILEKIPQMQAMGMKEFILDDGWFDRFGDWQPTREKFPRGEADMKALIDTIHAAGLKFRLWWSPGSADPGSEIDRKYPDWFILDQSGHREKASWNAYYLCPAYRPVREFTRGLVERFVKDWSVDSFKLDGTDLNHAPLCLNPAHHHARPEESFEQWPSLLQEIRQVAKQIRSDFRIELCPCGITPTFQLASAFEQPTDSDPFDDQVTARVKFLKALFGPRSPVLQEYVGLFGSQNLYGKEHPFRVDLFPRAIGTGQVVSTFSPVLGKTHAQWTALYNRYRPSEGEYLNLYDIRWENPEGHVIRKGEKFYYGFFTQTPGDSFSGPVQLRGLASRPYRVTDYVAGGALGDVSGPVATLHVKFHDSLLLVAEPLAP